MGYGPIVPRELGDSSSLAILGSGGGNAQFRIQKADASAGDIEFYSAGVHRMTIRLNSSENGQIILRDASGAATSTFTLANATGQLQIPSSLAVGGSSGPTISSGTGDPEGVVTAVSGSLYLRTDGAADDTLYVKNSDTTNTGWEAVQTT